MSYTQICGAESDQIPAAEEKDLIDVTIGVFFDGTCNNRYNIKSKFKYKETQKYKNQLSYHGRYSNVAELFECYKENKESNIVKAYIEGIGTTEENEENKYSGEFDTLSGYALGKGDTGINGKIVRGCKLISDAIRSVSSSGKGYKDVKNLYLDIFGFSRGASAARSFVNRIEAIQYKTISEGKEVCLRKYLTTRGINISKIEVRFLGIFDTVSSFAPGNILFDRNFSNDTKELELSIPTTVKQVVHLVAADEYRKNFALTTITPSNSAIELILPGSHSDIGGGYNIYETEKIVMKYYIYDNKVLCRGYMTFDELKEGNWIRQDATIQNVTHRKINNSYSRIPLNLMSELAKKSSIIFNNEYYSKMVNIPDNHRNILLPIKNRIMQMSSGGGKLYDFATEKGGKTIITAVCSYREMEMIKSIREKYIHLSATNEKALLKLFLEPHKTAKHRKRLIYNC